MVEVCLVQLLQNSTLSSPSPSSPLDSPEWSRYRNFLISYLDSRILRKNTEIFRNYSYYTYITIQSKQKQYPIPKDISYLCQFINLCTNINRSSAGLESVFRGFHSWFRCSPTLNSPILYRYAVMHCSETVTF